MQQLKTGVLLLSTSALNDTIFSGVSIFITEYNETGAVGFIINQPFGRSLNELEEFRHSPTFPLYAGGPVDKEHLYFLHQRPDLIDDAVLARNGIYFGGNFTKAISCINNGTLSPADAKIFVGYCGWDGGELEAEIEEGSWTIGEAIGNVVFS